MSTTKSKTIVSPETPTGPPEKTKGLTYGRWWVPTVITRSDYPHPIMGGRYFRYKVDALRWVADAREAGAA